MRHPPVGHQIGVDLGTSNTVAVLRWPDGRTRPLLFDGSPAMPAAVFLDDAGRLQAGQDAQRLGMLDPARFEPNPKRRIDEGTVLLGERELPVTDLLAAVLRRVADKAVETCGSLPPATLTCPAAWGSARRAILRDAAARAGWRTVRLVDEPVAAARYFTSVLARPLPPGGALAVFDFGGGTLDVAVVRRDPTGFTVLGSGGLEDLGGLDFDAALVEHLGERIADTDPDLWASLRNPTGPAERRNHRLFWEDVRAAKEMLSRSSTAPVAVPGLEQPVHLTRQEFEQLAGPLLDRAVDSTMQTIGGCRLAPRQLAGVFLVGGASRIPLVSSRLHRALGIAPSVLEQPEMPVAEGALGATDEATTRLVVGAPPRPAGRPVASAAGPTRVLRPPHGAPVPAGPAPGPAASPAPRAPVHPAPAPPRAAYRPAGFPPRVPAPRRHRLRRLVVLGSVVVLLGTVILALLHAADQRAYTFQRLAKGASVPLELTDTAAAVPLSVDGGQIDAAVPGHSGTTLISYDAGDGTAGRRTALAQGTTWRSVRRYRDDAVDVLAVTAAPDRSGYTAVELVGTLPKGAQRIEGSWKLNLPKGSSLVHTRDAMQVFNPSRNQFRRLEPASTSRLVDQSGSVSYPVPAGSRLVQDGEWTVTGSRTSIDAYHYWLSRQPELSIGVHGAGALAAIRPDRTRPAAGQAFIADPTGDGYTLALHPFVRRTEAAGSWSRPVPGRTARWMGLCGGNLCVIDAPAKDADHLRLTSYELARGRPVGHIDVTGLNLSGYWGDATTTNVVLVTSDGKGHPQTRVYDARAGKIVRSQPGTGYLVDDRAVLVFSPHTTRQQKTRQQTLTGLDLTGDRHTDLGTIDASGPGACGWDTHRIACVSGGRLTSWQYRKGGTP